MKKMFFLAATAALALSSCSSDEIVQEQPVVEDGAVVFSAGVLRDARASKQDINLDWLKTDAGSTGFGVFAYEHGTTAWNTYNTYNTVPNFMFNQDVTYGTVASYTLPESLDNEKYALLTDAQKTTYSVADTDGAHTVGAKEVTLANYADLDDAIKALCTAVYTTGATAEWEYSPVKYFSNNEGAMHSFFAYAPYNKDVKAVFSLANGAPAIRYNAADNYDLLWANKTEVKKPGVGATVNFAFAHALSKVDFKVTYFVDQIHVGSHNTGVNLEKDNTTITVRSVKFIGAVPSQGVLNLGTGNWTYEATEESAYEFAPADPVKFTWDGTSDDAANTYKVLTSGNLVLPTIDGNKVKVQVVYDVTTVDKENPRNNSTITNTITSTGEGYALTKGKYYSFKLDLGLTSVKFNVTEVEDWGAANDLGPVDLPNNLFPGLTAVPYIASATQPASCATGDVYYNTSDGNYYAASNTNTWGSALSPATVFYNPENGKYYDDAGFETEHSMSAGYYIIGGILYKKS